MIYFAIFILVIYIALITSFIIGFHKIKKFPKPTFQLKNEFSILIPFRNEEDNLNHLLNSFLNLSYQTYLFEILLINDASDDNSCKIIQQFQLEHSQLNITLLNSHRKSSSPKKDAINTAIEIAQFNWIVSTDADCEVPQNWLLLFNDFIETEKSLFISGPIKFKEEKSFLFHFQNLHFLSLIGSTIGSFGIKKPFLCNGANLCYNKQAFKELKGFEGNSNMASGDDIFLLEKFVKKYPEHTHFLKSKDAIVTTKSEISWNSFFNQQLRWTSKSSAYNNRFSIFVGFTVLVTNLIVLITGISLILEPNNWKFFISILLQKMFFDILLIEKTASFLNNKKSLKYFPIMSIIYPIFILVIGFFSFFKKFEWKGRKFKK